MHYFDFYRLRGQEDLSGLDIEDLLATSQQVSSDGGSQAPARHARRALAFWPLLTPCLCWAQR